MSAAEQLAIAGVAPPKKKPSLGVDMCSCGHEASLHRDRTGPCMWTPAPTPGARGELVTYDGKTMTRAEWRKKLGLEVDACRCKGMHERARETPARAIPTLERPAAAVDWFRGPPEIKTRLRGGWFIRTPATLSVFIANTKIESYNAVLKRAGAHFDPEMARRLVAGDANKRKGQKYRLEAALEQARAAELGVPKSAAIVRIGSPRMKDDDNLIPSCKHLRDAIAGELGFDDSRFNIGGSSGSGGDIPLFYRQQTAGARKAYAVLVEITW